MLKLSQQHQDLVEGIKFGKSGNQVSKVMSWWESTKMSEPDNYLVENMIMS